MFKQETDRVRTLWWTTNITLKNAAASVRWSLVSRGTELKKRVATAVPSYSLRWGHSLLTTSTLSESVKTLYSSVSVLGNRAALKRELVVSLQLNVADRKDITIQNGMLLTLWNAKPLDSNNPGTTKLSWRTQHISHKVWTSCATHRCHEEYNEMWLFR